MKALVTGGTGFIGSHLTEALVRKGVQVRCLVRTTSALKWLRGLPVELVFGNLNDMASLEKAVSRVDWVFHLAGVTRAIKKETYFEANDAGTNNLILACLKKNSGLQRFIYLSSQAAAGPSPNRCWKREMDPCEPVSYYGRSKRLGEKAVLAHSHEIPVLILRPSSVYGPRDKDVLPFFKCLSKRIKLCPVGPDQHLSLCHVMDIVQAMLLAAETQTLSGDIFFVSDGNDYRMDEIGDIMAEAIGVSALRLRIPKSMISGLASFSDILSKFFKVDFPITRDKANEMIQKNWVCDITKAKNILAFKPDVSLSEGAKSTFEWYKNEAWL